MCDSLLIQKQHISTTISKQSNQNRVDYRTRLLASVDCICFLLRQGLAFRGNDESAESKNVGNFLELLKWLCEHSDDIKVVCLKNVLENLKLTSPTIQRDIVRAISIEIVNVIMKQIGNPLFSILVEESRDISTKEQMAIVFRYVDKGRVIERFVGIEHVSSTCALSLKKTIDIFFSRHGLNISSLRGQGYDGASNMRGQFNGLKSLILEENESAYYVHCFSHQLQLALVAVAKKDEDVTGLFSVASKVVNIVGASPKRSDMLRDKQSDTVIEALNNGEILTGRGLNQETTLQRPGDTRWGSHYRTLIGFINMFSSIIDVLENINGDGTTKQKWDAKVLLGLIQSFSFVLTLHLMRNVLGITNDLSLAFVEKRSRYR